MILERGIIPPNALFEKLNPAIDAELLRVEVLKRCIPWPSAGLRRVSVNGFGFGGSNTHVVLDDARHFLEERGLSGHHCTAAAASAVNGHATNGDGLNGHADTDRQRLLVFSAFDERATQRTLHQYSTWYQANELSSQAKLDALAHTLAVRRSHMRWRSFAITAPSARTIASPARPTVVVSEPAVAWVFTGQGAQYVEMGRGLVDVYPVFKDTLNQVDEVYKSLGCTWSLFGRQCFPRLL